MRFFQKISYLQYPILLLAAYFAFKPYTYMFEEGFNHKDRIISDINSVLIFLSIGISFSTLQDTTKTQNNFSLRIWQNPKKGKIAIVYIAVLTFSVLIFGLSLFLFANKQLLKDLSVGIISLGIGLIGFLKAAIEIFNNHRLDKKKNNSTISEKE